MANIPPVKIPIARPIIGEEEARAVYEVIKSGWISMGRKVEEFEKQAADYIGVKHAIAMNNGTATLHALLMALDVRPGDEIIIPSLTYISTASAIEYMGATIILCDNDPDTYNVRPSDIEKHVTKKTKAFITVDMKGAPLDYTAFKQLSADLGVPFLADSAESFGATYNDEIIGSQALAHSFSFFANKNITTGEGGMVVTNDRDLARRLRMIRNQGQESRYCHKILGNNFRMTDIQAALGVQQLDRLEGILSAKQVLATRYSYLFSEIEMVDPPFIPTFVSRPSWYMYSVKLPKEKRDTVLSGLATDGIETRLSFPPVHVQPYYREKYLFDSHQFPNAQEAYLTFLDIPIWSGMDLATQDFVVEKIACYLGVHESNG